MSLLIAGAGLSGLIAANYFRKESPLVIEKQQTLPHNHSAVLRFRSQAVSTVTQIPFSRVRVRKAVSSQGALITAAGLKLANQYSLKVTGAVTDRSVWNLEPDDRFLAPENFIELLAQDVPVDYGRSLTAEEALSDETELVSTIPMPELMRIVDWPGQPEFSYRTIWALNVGISEPAVDVYQTIYYPDESVPQYRASLVGSRLIVEYVREPPASDAGVDAVLCDFGFDPARVLFESPPASRPQEYGKIVPIEEDVREEFIYTMAREHRTYCVGRYATWQQVLLDDTVGHLQAVEKTMKAERTRRRRTKRGQQQ